jgi:hypothetical protein
MALAMIVALVVGYAWSVWLLYDQRRHDPRGHDGGERRSSNVRALRPRTFRAHAATPKAHRLEDRRRRYAKP